MRQDMKVYYLRRSLFMKTLVITFFALTLLCAGGAQARSVKEMADTIKKPIEIEASGSKRMNVMFPHTVTRVFPVFSVTTKKVVTAAMLPAPNAMPRPARASVTP